MPVPHTACKLQPTHHLVDTSENYVTAKMRSINHLNLPKHIYNIRLKMYGGGPLVYFKFGVNNLGVNWFELL